MTRWKVDHWFVKDETTGEDIAWCKSVEHATQIVRDHNRAEAFEAMHEGLRTIQGECEAYVKSDWSKPVMRDKLKGILQIAEGGLTHHE